MASSQHRFVGGSIADVECGRDGAVGTDAMPHPYGFGQLALRALVYSAGERVESTRPLMYRDPPHVLSGVRHGHASRPCRPQRLTNMTHNALWAVVAGWQEVVAAQDGHVEPIWAHAMLAALATCP